MCGFSGFLSRGNWLNTSEKILNEMCDVLSHRGPNDKGIWSSPEYRVGLAHTRLSILDLSSLGHQPMMSASERYVIAFNGEIYNHDKLRRQLTRAFWRGHSDTETLLASFEEWGVEGTIERSIGMFSFAVWDKQEHTLTLGRDRAGEKPLYYGWCDDVFLFGSELKALKRHPSFKKDLNYDALALFLRHNYIPGPYSIYKGIHKLLPGTLLCLSMDHLEPKIKTYWSALQKTNQGLISSFSGDAHEAIDELEQLTKDAIRQQMMMDVPFGAFLSGGIDSSTVVSLMQSESSQPIKTFSIGFHEERYNEAQHAKVIAQHLGTEHTELYVTTKEALNVIPKLSILYDEPFSDSSQIPTFLVSQLAKKEVTVVLTGDAGDELFCGYNRYLMAANYWKKSLRAPAPLRMGAAKLIKSVSPVAWDKMLSMIPLKRLNHFGARLHKAANLFSSSTIGHAYHQLVSHHADPYSLLQMNGIEPSLFVENASFLGSKIDDVTTMMLVDFMSYLPDDILVKVDRASMGASLETRIPFLDHRIIEFAWSLPLSMKVKNGHSKWILRQLLQRYVPLDLIERPKMGFGIPLHEWLCGPLKSWADELLNKDRLKQEGVFDAGLINGMWQRYLNGTGNPSLLWSILMFQMWFENQ